MHLTVCSDLTRAILLSDKRRKTAFGDKLGAGSLPQPLSLILHTTRYIAPTHYVAIKVQKRLF